MTRLKWSDWLDFGQLYEYHGFIDDTGGPNRSRKILSYLGKKGPLHQDDGFRLRSNQNPSTGSQIPLSKPLEELPCPLKLGDIGCYWVKIEVPGKIQLDYIGQSSEKKWGISKRLTDHLRKICSIPETSDISWGDIRGIKTTKKFTKASARLKALGLGDITDPKIEFFERYVKIKLIIVPDTVNASYTIHRIEGMAMAAYKNKYGFFPHLNKRDETAGLDGLF